MTEAQINILITLAMLWSVVMLPWISVLGILKFMDIMRRRKDEFPW
jgi:hypothetical protein